MAPFTVFAVRRWIGLVFIVGAALSAVAGGQHAQAQASTTTPSSAAPAATPTIIVATKPLDPFVMQRGDELQGFSVDLWEEVARRNRWTYEWQLHEKVGEVLDSVAAENAQVGIAGISMTSDREQAVDFSFPMFNAGLQIAVPAENSTGFLSGLRSMFNADMLRLFAIVGVIVVVVGHVIWLVERNRDPKFARQYSRGVGEGVWQAGSTVMQAGYGDRPPDKAIGRVAALVWMFIGIVFVANLQAILTSDRTIERLNSGISDLNDLPGKRVVTVDGSTADTFLTERGIPHGTVARIEDAYKALDSDAPSADAVVYDSPVLLYYAATGGKNRVRVVGTVVKSEPYGIAFPIGSPLREDVNRTLLEITADGTYEEIYQRWFGTRTG